MTLNRSFPLSAFRERRERSSIVFSAAAANETQRAPIAAPNNIGANTVKSGRKMRFMKKPRGRSDREKPRSATRSVV
jgi:hypothetical protein